MSKNRLATFLHISDLHVGDIDPARNDGTYDADAPRYWRYSRLFEGLLGHTVVAMEHLEDFVSQIVDDEKARMIITGDLTCTGKAAQFNMASLFLGQDVILPSGNVFGLRHADWKERCIGGNHDQWDGRMPLLKGGISPAYHAIFPRVTFPRMAPESHVKLTDGRSLRVRFAMINSDADSRSAWPSKRRILARGMFSNQLASQAINLGPRPSEEIRTLLIHHSPTYGHPSRLRIHKPCRDALDGYLIDQEISVVMAGHIHIPRVRPFTAHNKQTGAIRDVLEARSGTATQRDEIPARWHGQHSQWGNWPLPQNTVLVHRLQETVAIDSDPVVDWETTMYWRDRGGFVPIPGDPVSFRVWP